MDELLVAIQDAANTIAAPNWADIMSVCFSLLAVVVAGIIAWRQNEISKKQTFIAENQNKIALFEKRFEIYEILSACRSSAHIIKMLGESEDALKCLFIAFAGDPKEYQELTHREVELYLTNISEKLLRAAYFFPEEITPHIINMSARLVIFSGANIKADGPKKYRRKKQDYFEAVEALEENKVFERSRKEMKII